MRCERCKRNLAAGYPDVRFADGGTLGLNLLPMVEEADRLLILDCIDAGQPAGWVIQLEGDQIPRYGGIKMSQHPTTFQEVLGLADIRHKLPAELVLIGIRPASLAMGTDPSTPVARALPEMLRRARACLEQWSTADQMARLNPTRER
jgi:hydrogenase maturation protease